MLDSIINQIHPPLSFVIFGALGGLLYCLRQKLRRHPVRPAEYLIRPVFGMVSAYVLVEHFGFPDHFNSLVLGYFGIDVFEAIVNRIDVKGLLTFAKHERAERVPTKPPADETEEDPHLPL